jgi:hypothetical protein
MEEIRIYTHIIFNAVLSKNAGIGDIRRSNPVTAGKAVITSVKGE